MADDRFSECPLCALTMNKAGTVMSMMQVLLFQRTLRSLTDNYSAFLFSGSFVVYRDGIYDEKVYSPTTQTLLSL